MGNIQNGGIVGGGLMAHTRMCDSHLGNTPEVTKCPQGNSNLCFQTANYCSGTALFSKKVLNQVSLAMYSRWGQY